MSNKQNRREDNVRTRERFSDNKARFNQDFKRIERQLKLDPSKAKRHPEDDFDDEDES